MPIAKLGYNQAIGLPTARLVARQAAIAMLAVRADIYKITGLKRPIA